MLTFEELVAAESVALKRLAWTLTGDRQQAEDLVQDTLLKVYLKWRRVRGADDPAAYVRRMLVNVHRDRRPERETVVDELPETRAPLTEQPLAERAALVQALRELPLQQRQVVALRFVDDQSIAATAAILGCSSSTVTTQSSRALARLRVDPELASLLSTEVP